MLRTESPPSSKKSSSTPTSSTSSVRAQTEAISFSVAVRGAAAAGGWLFPLLLGVGDVTERFHDFRRECSCQ
ncbi:hypothetical protein ABZ863_33545, partial [Saccharomonospora sp. NPDC046836]|uniref:hypothetical protein n=1 Tax=Saccharomonospora sp. NPDC046836 TaxID=3156921 RepID=UPI0033D4933A